MSKGSVLSNFIWRLAERSGAQGVAFVVSIVLARLLAPEDYGTIALVTVFTSILNVFIDSGMANALIQKKDADDLDFSSVFYFNVSVCLVLYAGMFLAAPAIAAFYDRPDRPDLTPVIRVLSLTLIISGVKNVQQAYVSRTMQFKRFFFATLGGTVGAAALGIWLACRGYGVWALVAQQLFNATVDTVILWITVKWRPKKMFSLQRLQGLLSYGWKLLASGLLETAYNNLRSLIIGKLYSSGDLAFYNKGKQMPHLIITNINTSIDSVLLPTMSREQENRDRVRTMTRRAIMTSTYILSPLLLGLAFCAQPLIAFLLTEKWLPSVFFLRVFCVTYLFYPIHTANLNAIKAMGRSDLFLKLEILKKAVGLLAVVITMWISVEAMAYSLLVTSFLSQLINSWPNRKLLGYSYTDQLKDILPGMLLALGMGLCVWPIQLLGLPHLVTLLMQFLLGAALYLAASHLLKLEAWQYVKSVLQPILRKLAHRHPKEETHG